MNNRLCELLKSYYNEDGTGSFVYFFTDDEAENVASYLEDNGVNAPPCDLGDNVYLCKVELNEVCPAKVIGIYRKFYTPATPFWIELVFESKSAGKQVIEITGDVYSLLCHDTKEEAEQHMREMMEVTRR